MVNSSASLIVGGLSGGVISVLTGGDLQHGIVYGLVSTAVNQLAAFAYQGKGDGDPKPETGKRSEQVTELADILFSDSKDKVERLAGSIGKGLNKIIKPLNLLDDVFSLYDSLISDKNASFIKWSITKVTEGAFTFAGQRIGNSLGLLTAGLCGPCAIGATPLLGFGGGFLGNELGVYVAETIIFTLYEE